MATGAPVGVRAGIVEPDEGRNVVSGRDVGTAAAGAITGWVVLGEPGIIGAAETVGAGMDIGEGDGGCGVAVAGKPGREVGLEGAGAEVGDAALKV